MLKTEIAIQIQLSFFHSSMLYLFVRNDCNDCKVCRYNNPKLDIIDSGFINQLKILTINQLATQCSKLPRNHVTTDKSSNAIHNCAQNGNRLYYQPSIRHRTRLILPITLEQFHFTPKYNLIAGVKFKSTIVNGAFTHLTVSRPTIPYNRQ